MSIYEKMYSVMTESESLEKNMTVGTGQNAYKAVSESEILNMIKPLFKKHKLIIFPIDGEIEDHCMVWDKTGYKGEVTKALRAMTELKVVYRILDIETGEHQDVVGFGNGADPQDKGAGKAFTYSFKNALSKTFMLFSGEDTDNDHSDDIGHDKSETKKLTDKQVKRAYAIARTNKISPQDVKKWIMQKYKKTNVEDLTKVEYDALVASLEKGAK